MDTAAIRRKVSGTAPSGHANMQNALSTAQKLDFTPLFEFDVRLKTEPALRARFIANPNEVVHQETGFVVPDGYHCHYIDGDNYYYPPEGDALTQLKSGVLGDTWARVEIRIAAGPGCFAFCGVCHNKGTSE